MIIHFQKSLAEKVIYAINAGGESHSDTYGIRYQRDPLRSVGTASDYGKQLLIGNVSFIFLLLNINNFLCAIC